MAGGVAVADGVIKDVTIAVKRLRIGGVGDEGVGAGEFTDARDVVTCVVVHQPQIQVFPLAGVAPVG